MQSEFAVTAARHIGQNDARNRTLASIVKAQLKAAETAQTNPPGDVDEMLDKAVLTASYVDSDSWKNTVFELLAIQMALSGRFLDAAEQAAKIPDNKKRNAALSDLTRRHVIVSRWYRSPGTSRYTVTRIEDRETAYKAIISHMDDPKVKSLALYNLAIYFGARNDQNNIISPKKCEEYLAASLDTLVAIENPGMREINILTRVAELYKELGMNEKAKSVRDLLNSRIADLEPGKRGGG
ncbi:MAG: hypothetical protein FWH27_17065 [Planctomycetaceae bacterium]|nr:hypothetical protein [Planctomycetaceae bacterium]